MSTTAAVWRQLGLYERSTCNQKRFLQPKKSETAQGGKNLKPTGVQHPVGSPSLSSRKHRSASREGWGSPSAREPRGAERPRASMHPTKKPQAERLAPAPTSPGGVSAGAHAIEQTRHRARRRARRAVSRLEAAQDGAESCPPRRNGSLIYLCGVDQHNSSTRQSRQRAARSRAPVSILAPQTLSGLTPQSRILREAFETVGPTRVAVRHRCAAESSSLPIP